MSPTKNHILIGLSESERTKFGKEDFASQSVPQKAFSALWEVESEVNKAASLSISSTTAQNRCILLWKPSG